MNFFFLFHRQHLSDPPYCLFTELYFFLAMDKCLITLMYTTTRYIHANKIKIVLDICSLQISTAFISFFLLSLT